MEIAFKQVYDNNVQNHILWYMFWIEVLRYKLLLSQYWKIAGHICYWNIQKKVLIELILQWEHICKKEKVRPTSFQQAYLLSPY